MRGLALRPTSVEQMRSRLRDLGEHLRAGRLPADLPRPVARAAAVARPLLGRTAGVPRSVGAGRLALAGLGGALLGAALMYLLDPETGRDRRARLRERLGRYVDRTTRTLDETSRDVVARTRGLVVEMRNRMRGGPRAEGAAEEVRGPEGR